MQRYNSVLPFAKPEVCQDRGLFSAFELRQQGVDHYVSNQVDLIP